MRLVGTSSKEHAKCNTLQNMLYSSGHSSVIHEVRVSSRHDTIRFKDLGVLKSEFLITRELRILKYPSKLFSPLNTTSKEGFK